MSERDIIVPADVTAIRLHIDHALRALVAEAFRRHAKVHWGTFRLTIEPDRRGPWPHKDPWLEMRLDVDADEEVSPEEEPQT